MDLFWPAQGPRPYGIACQLATCNLQAINFEKSLSKGQRHPIKLDTDTLQLQPKNYSLIKDKPWTVILTGDHGICAEMQRRKFDPY